MGLGKQIRLARIFSHSSGKLCSVAVDHFVGYQKGLPGGLTDLPKTLAALVAAGPDAVTMNKGTAMSCWAPYAGKVPMIVQAGCFTPDDSVMQVMAEPEEAVRLGADAIAIAFGVRGPNEGQYLKMLADTVAKAAVYDLPVIAHIYPRDFSGLVPAIVHDPENIAWAVRAGIEFGADVIKVGYTGDRSSFASIVESCPVPVVIAGGPKCETVRDALEMIADAMRSGARGATIGRNVWGAPDIGRALQGYLDVIHDGASVDRALGDA